MLGKRIINTATDAGAACTTDTVQILGDTSCIAYYKMSDATDETGSYDGTATNVNFNVAGKFGNAGEFGANSYINANSTLLGQTFTFSSWINLSSYNSNTTWLFGQYTGGASGRFLVNISASGVLQVGVSSVFYYSTGYTVPLNSWVNIVVIKDSSYGWYFYANDSLIGQSASTANIQTNVNTYFGGHGLLSNGGVKGKMDNVRIFDRAITANEVTTLYNEVQCIPTIVPTDHFEPVLYTGNGGTQSITSLDFAPDFTWIKSRTTGDGHLLFDSVRGATKYLFIQTNAEGTAVNSLTSFDPNGFTLGSDTGSGYNGNGYSFVSWNWKAGGAAVSATSIEATNATRSANVDAGFSIIKFQSSASTPTPPPMNYIEHGLDSTPKMVIYKATNSTSAWRVMHVDNGQKWIELQSTAATAGPFTYTIWDNTPTSIGVRSNYAIGANEAYIAYCFAEVDGFSKIGSYTGTGASGNAIVTGFRPAYVMIKSIDKAVNNWDIFDNKRDTTNPNTALLQANASGAEVYPPLGINFLSNGFEPESNYFNDSGNTFIFMAFAEENAQPEPELANSFNVVTYTGNGSTQAVTGLGFQPDLVWVKNRDSSGENHQITDIVSGFGKVLYPNLTNAQAGSDDTYFTELSNGFSINTNNNNILNNDYVAWCWKASNDSTINQDGSITSIVSANPAAGFSIVKYTGTGSLATVGHGLSSAPEMIMVKGLDNALNWIVYHTSIGSTKYIQLNTTGAEELQSNYNMFNSTAPSSTSFSLGTLNNTNGNNLDYIAYCFHSVDGHQKVGSYSGSGGAGNKQTIGFKPKFLMVKLTNGGGSWWIFDSARTPNDPRNKTLRADTNDTDYTLDGVDFEIDGFSFNSLYFNESGSNFIYLAIA